jgi:uncharacterized protein (TIGR02453 family)
MKLLVLELSEQFKAEGIDLKGDPSTSLFRIHRDVRFSKDKSPYHTYAAFSLSKSGARLEQGMLHFRISPDESFFATGLYEPDGATLRAARTQIVSLGREFLHWEDEFNLHTIASAKRLPPGFEDFANSELEDVLKWKHYLTKQAIQAGELLTDELVEKAISFVRERLLFINFCRQCSSRTDSINITG